eukprot:9553651-Lingulodinium_polyedra.AAC.1
MRHFHANAGDVTEAIADADLFLITHVEARQAFHVRVVAKRRGGLRRPAAPASSRCKECPTKPGAQCQTREAAEGGVRSPSA